MNKDKIIIKICKSVIVVFGVLTVFNVIMLINKKSYALFQKTVKTDTIIHIQTANEFPSDNKAADKLKDKVGQVGEIKGVNPKTGKECASTEECPEYRYVGKSVNNYVYFNCEPNQEQNSKNCEMWRIVGIFKDELEGEHLKIVKDEVLKANDFPTEYTKDTVTYKIRGSSGDTAYWNNKSGYNNDWATAGLQYWLNDETGEGYLSKLTEEAKGMIATTKYYLGSVSSYNSKKDTPITAYQHERAVEGCDGGKGPSTNSTSSTVESNTSCRVWANNSATWTGKVGLLYPSDYGFSADSSNWTKVLYDYETPSQTSWLQSANHSSFEWLLSPSSYNSDSASYWYTAGCVLYNYVYSVSSGVRPVLNLESRVGITGGAGTESNPYQLEN